MGKKVELVKTIAADGCYGIDCRDCPFSINNDSCDAISHAVLLDSPAIKAQARAWLEARAKRKAEKRAMKARKCQNCGSELIVVAKSVGNANAAGSNYVAACSKCGATVNESIYAKDTKTDDHITEITRCGEVYKVGDKFRLVAEDETEHYSYGDIGTITAIRSGNVIEMDGKIVGNWRPWIKEDWQRVTDEPASPAWDGKFVPGGFYRAQSGLVVLCTGDGDSVTFPGVVVIKSYVHAVGERTNAWTKHRFYPVKVKITVEE